MKPIVILTNFRSASQHFVNLINNMIIGCTIPKYTLESTEILNYYLPEEQNPYATRHLYFKNKFNRSPINEEEILEHAIEITKKYLNNFKLFKLFKEMIPLNILYSEWLLENIKTNKINAVNLIRKNALHRYISLRISEQTKIWHTCDTIKSITHVTVDIYNLLYFIQNDKVINNSYDEKYGDYVYNLYYEDLVRDPKNSIINVAQWFNELIGPFENTNLKITNPFNMRDVITNYKDVENCLLNTENEWMLY